MSKILVPVVKVYSNCENRNSIIELHGEIPVEATEFGEAVDIVTCLLYDPKNPLQTLDPRIVWEEVESPDGYEYEDFSFEIDL